MAKQRFPLQSVLQLQQADRDLQQHKLCEARQAEKVAGVAVSQLHNRLTSVQLLLRQALTPGKVSIEDIRTLQFQERKLRAKLQLTEQKQSETAERCEQERDILSNANRQVRMLEGLADRRQQEQHRESARQETRELDDLSSRSSSR